MRLRTVGIIILTALTVLVLQGPLTISAQSPCEDEYTVQAGDWLSKIAEKYFGDVLAYDQIVALTNSQSDPKYTKIENPDLIEPGWVLCIPAVKKAIMSADVLLNQVTLVQHNFNPDTNEEWFTCASSGQGLNGVAVDPAGSRFVGPNSGDFDLWGAVGLFEVAPDGTITFVPQETGGYFVDPKGVKHERFTLEESLRFIASGDAVWTGAPGESGRIEKCDPTTPAGMAAQGGEASTEAKTDDENMEAAAGGTEIIQFEPATVQLDPNQEPQVMTSCQPSQVVPRAGVYQCASDSGSNFDPCWVVAGNTLLCNPRWMPPLFEDPPSHTLATAPATLPEIDPAAASAEPVDFFLALENNNPPCNRRADLEVTLTGQPVTHSCDAPAVWLVGDLDKSQPTWTSQRVITNPSAAPSEEAVTDGPTPVAVQKAWVY